MSTAVAGMASASLDASVILGGEDLVANLAARAARAGIKAATAEVGYRAARQAYVNGARAIASDGLARIAAGADPSAVARAAVDARNALKAAAREGLWGPIRSALETRNMMIYGDKIGPTYEYFVAQGKLPESIVAGAGRTDSFIDWLMGVR